MTPIPTVSRSRLRSATDEPPRLLETPPPNMSDSPPPRPLCMRTRRISTELVITRMMVKSRVTSATLTHTCAEPARAPRRSQHRHVVEPADPAELVGLEARAAHQCPVDVVLRHDACDVRGLHRSAVEDAQRSTRLLAVQLADAGPDRGAHHLRVVRGGHPTGAHRPHGPA